MTDEEFNIKYARHIASGYYGMSLGDDKVIDVIDSILNEYLDNSRFVIYQIKEKFNSIRFYFSGIPDEVRIAIESIKLS
jgi:hypothetical protein